MLDVQSPQQLVEGGVEVAVVGDDDEEEAAPDVADDPPQLGGEVALVAVERRGSVDGTQQQLEVCLGAAQVVGDGRGGGAADEPDEVAVPLREVSHESGRTDGDVGLRLAAAGRGRHAPAGRRRAGGVLARGDEALDEQVGCRADAFQSMSRRRRRGTYSRRSLKSMPRPVEARRTRPRAGCATLRCAWIESRVLTRVRCVAGPSLERARQGVRTALNTASMTFSGGTWSASASKLRWIR